jgi:hypothetical protein
VVEREGKPLASLLGNSGFGLALVPRSGGGWWAVSDGAKSLSLGGLRHDCDLFKREVGFCCFTLLLLHLRPCLGVGTIRSSD